jgi:hypothetical protein
MAILWIRIHHLFGLIIDYEVTASSVARCPLSLQVDQSPGTMQSCTVCWQNQSQKALRISAINCKGYFRVSSAEAGTHENLQWAAFYNIQQILFKMRTE